MKPTYEELERQLEESRREFRAADATIHNLELKLTDMAVQLANAESKCREMAEFKSRVYAQMGAGCEAPEFAITEGLNNLRRFADTLHAIEREFFTKEVPDEECEGEKVEECPLCWGMTVEQYVSEFGKCLAEVRAIELDSLAGVAETMLVKFSNQRCSSDMHEVVGWKMVLQQACNRAAKLRKGAAL
ncbi:eae-like domain protein [Citrobacter portucalensis]|uniref:eae-like domain protein n=1 Tax=Citrobacter portucalensis TaxID=1639133 RepID=UPI001E40B6DD|nr:eae-like domain protein [Citrobacter portucalensis]